MPEELTRRQALLDVALVLALTVAGVVAAAAIGHVLQARLALPQLLVLSLQGVFVLAGVQLLLLWRKQSWRGLGLLPPRPLDALRGLLAVGCIFALNALLSMLAAHFVPAPVEAHQQRLIDFAEMLTSGLPFGGVAATMLFVGFYEEMVARGFLLTRCRTLVGGSVGPVLLSSLLFGLGHAYQGWVGVLQTMLVGVVLATLTLRWGTLWPAIFAHAMLNTLSLGVLRELGSAT